MEWPYFKILKEICQYLCIINAIHKYKLINPFVKFILVFSSGPILGPWGKGVRRNRVGRKKKQVLREGISARILVPVLEELKWAEQQFPYLNRSELIQTAIAFYLRELRKAGMEAGSWFPKVPHLEDISKTPEGAICRQVRDLWEMHGRAEGSRDISGILNTLTPDCVYEIPQWGYRWDGHQGAEEFYAELYHAFPDLTLHHKRIVVGPQGVAQETKATGTQAQSWLRLKPKRRPLTFSTVSFFFWDGAQERFKGECLYFSFQPAGQGKRMQNLPTPSPRQ